MDRKELIEAFHVAPVLSTTQARRIFADVFDRAAGGLMTRVRRRKRSVVIMSLNQYEALAVLRAREGQEQ